MAKYLSTFTRPLRSCHYLKELHIVLADTMKFDKTYLWSLYYLLVTSY